jgi:hypothetical protein
MAVLRLGGFMAVLVDKAWGDDSDDGVISAVACVVGRESDWGEFERLWRRDVLKRFGLPYTHMREFKQFKGPFAKFKGDDALTRQFNEAMIGAVRRSRLRPFASATRLADLQRFNQGRGRDLDAYSLNLYACCFLMRVAIPAVIIEAVMDRTNGIFRKLELAECYAASHAGTIDITDKIQAIPLAKGVTAKDLPAMQGADFCVWEVRKDYTFKDKFFDLRESAKGYQAWRVSMSRRAKANLQRWPYHRGSLAALARGTKPWHIIWDFDALCAADERRNGVWCGDQAA